MNNLLKVEISAETEEQANNILNALLKKRLMTGGQIIEAPARFLWKGEITSMNYFMITSFSLEAYKNEITRIVTEVSAEEVPMITYLPMQANPALETWIKETVKA